MSFKIKKARFNLTIQPKNEKGQTQATIDLSNVSKGIANINATALFDTIIQKDDPFSSETLEALNNRHVSKNFEDLYRRGVNPLRAEIILYSEMVPIAKGDQDENSNDASINLNYGEGSNLQVNQVMRLIDLQRIIRKTILKVSGDFLGGYFGASEESQEKIIKFMHKLLKDNSEDFVSLAPNTELMVDKLIELSFDESLFPALGSWRYTTHPLAIFNVYAREERISLREKIKSVIGTDKEQFVRSLTRYVILDYVTQNSIAFITKMYDLKDLLRESISIGHTHLPGSEMSPASKNYTFTSSDGTVTNYIMTKLPIKSLIAGTVIANSTDTQAKIVPKLSPRLLNRPEIGAANKVERANKLLQRHGNQNSQGPDGYSGSKKHSLSSVINASVSSSKTEEVFGSNRHMYCNLFSNMLRHMTFMTTLSSDSPHSIQQSNVSLGNSKNLASGIKKLKSMTVRGMMSDLSPLESARSSEKVTGNSIKSMLDSVSDDHEKALVELMSAVCFDQVAGVNILGGGLGLLAPKNFDNFPKLNADGDNLVLDYFNKTFFDTGTESWGTVTAKTQIPYRQFAQNENKLGKFMQSRFSPKTDEEKEEKYISNEHTYEDNPHRQDSFVNAPDYFFSEAIASEELKFDKMVEESDRVKFDVDTIVHDISAMMGLDFNDDGKADVGNINAFSDGSNPVAYFYSMCDALGKDLETASKSLKNHAVIAAPILEAGTFNDYTFLANTIKASFFGCSATELNGKMIINTLENPDTNRLFDRNIKKKNSAYEEVMTLFKAENAYYSEEKVWYKLWSSKLKSLLKNQSEGDLRDTQEQYPANKKKKYTSIINNGAQTGGVGILHSGKNSDGAYTWESKGFGAGKREDGIHPDYVDKIIVQEDTDEKLGNYLNIETQFEWGKVVLGLAIGVALAPLGMSAFATATATSFVGSFTFIGLFSLWAPSVTAAAYTGAAVAGALTAAAMAGHNRPKKCRPTGVAFTGNGVFESMLLANSALIPPEMQPSEDDTDEAREEMESIMSKTLYGCPSSDASGEIYFLKARSGNGTVKQWQLESMVDYYEDIMRSVLPNWLEDILGVSEDSVPDSERYKPYFFNFNQNAGNYGGIFKTTTAQRWILFSAFFGRMMNRCLYFRMGAVKSTLHLKMYPAPYIGMSDALQRKSRDQKFQEGGKYEQLKVPYNRAYDRAHAMMDEVVTSMKYRRCAILKNLLYLKQNSDEIKEAVTKSENLLQGKGSDITFGEKIALKHLRSIGYAKQGMAFLNDNTAGTLLKNYERNYVLDFRSDKDENVNPEGISVFPYFKKESYDIRELKLMAKVFSQQGKGFTSDKSDNRGRKGILHIGIPNGMIRALQNEAYRKTSEIEYYYSNNIVIHITKINDLDPSIKYQARSYVFNMSKYVSSFKTSDSYKKIVEPGVFSMGNHLENYDDNWSIEDIFNNIEIMTSGRKAPEYNQGLPGIKMSSGTEEAIYGDEIYKAMLHNHVFDYYSKMYLESTTGIHVSDTAFPMNQNLLYQGQIDPGAKLAYDNAVNEITRLYPAANIDEVIAQERYRILRTMRSSVYFSPENRYETTLGTQCFQRVFSIPISERDFLLKQNSYNIDPADIYDVTDMPKIRLTCAPAISFSKISVKTGEQETTPLSYGRSVGRSTPSKKLRDASTIRKAIEFKKSIDPFKTDVGAFLIEVALLKTSKLDF